MNAFVASYDLASDEVRFRMEPVVNGQILDSDGEFISLSQLSKDLWAHEIAVADGDSEMEDGYLAEDEPSLREHLAGILNRRFESTREGVARSMRAFEKSGYKTYREYMEKRPKPVLTLRDLERAHWDSDVYKDLTISFFKQHGVLPEFDEEGNVIQIAKKDDGAYPEFPKIPGSIGDLADALWPDIPYMFKVVAGFTHFGLIRSGLDTLAAEPYLQPRLYSALVAGPGRGKTAAINEINRVFKAVNSAHSYSVWPSVNSGEALVDTFNDQTNSMITRAEVGNTIDPVARVLLSPDEIRGLIEKSKSTSNSRNTMLDELLKLYEFNTTGNRIRGNKTSIRIESAHLALVGGATPSGYKKMWIATGASADGLHTRFVTVAADLPRMPARPRMSDIERVNELTQELQQQAAEPGTAYEITEEAYDMFAKWWEAKPTDNPHVTRIDGIVKRVLVILARTNDADVIDVELMKPAIAFGDYVQYCRENLNPKDAVNYTQAFEQLIMDAFKKRGPMSGRDLAKVVKPENHDGGHVAFNNAFNALQRSCLKIVIKNRKGNPVWDIDTGQAEE